MSRLLQRIYSTTPAKSKMKKTAAITHTFTNKWCVWVDNPENNNMEEQPVDILDTHNFEAAKKLAENMFKQSKDILLDVLQETVPTAEDISFELTPENCTTIVTYSAEPDKDVLDATADFITGQWADGFGEGLEQNEFASCKVEVDVGYEDEETGEYVEDYDMEDEIYYVKLWPENFKLDY